MNLSVVLAIVSGCIYLSAYFLYYRQILSGKSKPNVASWTIWAFESGINFSSYIVMSGDWVKSVLPFLGTVACMAIFIYALFNGRFSKPTGFELSAMGIGLLSLTVWKLTAISGIPNSALYANMIIQFCVVVSFIPTFRGTWKNPMTESYLPWFMWGFTYLASMSVVLMRWSGQYFDLAYYVIGTTFHLTVGFLALRAVKDNAEELAFQKAP